MVTLQGQGSQWVKAKALARLPTSLRLLKISASPEEKRKKKKQTKKKKNPPYKEKPKKAGPRSKMRSGITKSQR